MATPGMLTKISAGLLLAVTMLVIIPKGFVTANSLAGGWFNFEGSAADGVTHDRDISEIAFEPAIDPLVLGAALLAGFVVLLVTRRLGSDKISTVLHGVVAGIAIGSMAVVAGMTMTVLVAIAALLPLGVATFERTGDTTSQRIAIAGAAVAAVASYVLLRSLNVELVALALLFAAGTFLYTSTDSILSP